MTLLSSDTARDTDSAAAPAGLADPHALHRIFALPRERTGHDFRHYKPQTILRRIERRLHLHRLDDLAGYYALLDAEADEAGKLFQELPSGVTRFFRDGDERAVQAALRAAIERLIPG